MQKAIIAKKVGMTRIFDESGRSIPVTVLEAGPCTVISKKTPEKDGYTAIQVGFLRKKEKRLNKPIKGHLDKAGVGPVKYIREFKLSDIGTYEIGQDIKADIFSSGDYVDVTGISRGKGFAGSIKRHGHSRGPMSHGSRYHRGPGTLGSIDPARVFKGMKLPGRMGGERVTVQKLEVVKVDPERNVLLLKGAVPGPRGGLLMIKESVKVS